MAITAAQRLLLGSWVQLLVSLYTPAFATVPLITNPSFINECVKVHNKFRAEVRPTASGMLTMTWDEGLAKTARAWSRTCQFKHNPNLSKKGIAHPSFNPVGENIFASTGSFNAKHAIKRWYDEVVDYDYSTTSCKPNKVCGHYTQLVWAATYKVGCSVSDCPKGIKGSGLKGPGVIFVCDYAPAGNYVGASPFSSGGSCSECTGGCNNKLCKYPNWNPNFGSASTSLCDRLLLLSSIIVIYILQ
ncbi:glioma pathogenesis-related protein 1 [Heptranchias perlo]|uniref:glioma pathogenesis-related protein 1 n=1 Tax=Heptranchias perlo TaxID=212740 RepID=UPI00355A5431